MNFNFSSFLSGSLKILNIANKTIPLIKEVNPTVKSIKSTIGKFKNNTNQKIKEVPFIKAPKLETNKRINQLNTLTFFR